MIWRLSDNLEERRSRLLDEGYDAYCIFSRSGNEFDIIREQNRLHEEVLVLPFLRLKHLCRKGVRSTEQENILPGYVFLFLPKGMDVSCIRPSLTGFRILRSEENPTGLLKGSDLKYAEWVLTTGGVLGMSKAIRKNGRVKIVSGPLFSLEGKIVEYSPRSRSCRVEVELFNRIVSTWLPFEYVETIENKTEEDKTKEDKKTK
ncbi:MAG: hypothetical protein KBS81_04270 [Spirochaetales bacterium]|nr:hypothetical protein [Candidatus Physcosoma equi]